MVPISVDTPYELTFKYIKPIFHLLKSHFSFMLHRSQVVHFTMFSSLYFNLIYFYFTKYFVLKYIQTQIYKSFLKIFLFTLKFHLPLIIVIMTIGIALSKLGIRFIGGCH